MTPYSITSAKHEDGTEYSVGDRVCIYQGRFGHNNIIVIKSMWQCDGWVAVSSENALPGTNINAIKHKITDKLDRQIKKAKQLARKYHYTN